MEDNLFKGEIVMGLQSFNVKEAYAKLVAKAILEEHLCCEILQEKALNGLVDAIAEKILEGVPG